MLVRHTEDTRLLREVFLEICACDPRIVAWPQPQFVVMDLAESGCKVCMRPFVRPPDYWPVWWDLREQIRWQVCKPSIVLFFFFWKFNSKSVNIFCSLNESL